MSISLFISCLQPPIEVYLSDYRIIPNDYAQKLQQTFLYAKIHFTLSETQSTYLLGWSLDEGKKIGMTGGLQNDAITVSFSNGYWNTKDYILWHRRYIPEYVPLYLFNENLSIIYSLTSSTSKADLTNLLGHFEEE